MHYRMPEWLKHYSVTFQSLGSLISQAIIELEGERKLLIKGKEDAELYLSDGMIVHARTSYSLGQNAFFMIMSWETGRILYDSDAGPQEKTIDVPTEQLLLNWSYKKHHFEKIREVIPQKISFSVFLC